ncbi:toxin VasX [Motilimonas sp. E26]|uniref:toxin VasX n=1 Tax=Motilimonas sp. E26 TaxID=2865674 RepID=UPI001E417FAB|nr:toxin VasX [Motilimonas sp. E26]MCE0559233.1 hypothetical protein [Motilimonas sp. E26]
MSAVQDAKNSSQNDVKAPCAPCALMNSRIQLVPVRYAIVESPAQHRAIASRHSSKLTYRPVGIRPAHEGGYLYLIHSQRPDIVYAYQLGENGAVTKIEQQSKTPGDYGGPEFIYDESETSIVMKRSGSVWALYTHTKISAKLQGQLILVPELRDALMQKCDLAAYQVNIGARHLLPPNDLAANLADCDPNKSDNPLDQQWCWLTEKPQAIAATDVTQHILPKYKDDSAILLLEDPISMATELSGAAQAIRLLEKEWEETDKNKEKFFAATNISALIEIDNQRIKNASGQDPDFAHLEEQQWQELRDLYEEYDRATTNYSIAARSLQHTSYPVIASVPTDPAVVGPRNKVMADMAVMANKIGVPRTKIEALFRRVRQGQRSLLYGAGLGIGDDGVAERVNLPEMKAWLSAANVTLDIMQTAALNIDNDRTYIIEPAYAAIPVFDKENPTLLAERLGLEIQWLYELGLVPENIDKLRNFFFHQVGEQNLQLWVNREKGTLKDYAAAEGDLYYFLTMADQANTTKGGEDGLTTLRATLEGKGLTLLEDMPEAIKKQLDAFNATLLPLTVSELNELSRKAADLTSNYDPNSFFKTAPKGLLATFSNTLAHTELLLSLEPGPNAPDVAKIVTAYDQRILTVEKLWQERESIRNYKPKITPHRSHQKRKLTRKEIEEARLAAQRRIERIAEIDRQIRAQGISLETLVEDIRQQDLAIKGHPSEAAVKPFRNSKTPGAKLMIAGQTPDSVEELAQIRKKLLFNELTLGSPDGNTGSLASGSAGSSSIALFVLVLNKWNYDNTKTEYEKKSQLTGKQEFHLLSDKLGMLAAGTALAMEVAKTAAMTHWAYTGSESSLKLLSKVMVVGTGISAGLGAISAVFDMVKQADRIERSWRKGDYTAIAGATIAATGDVLQAAPGAAIAWTSGRQAILALLGRITWQTAASTTLGLATRLNPYMLAGTLLVFVGEVVYNMTQSTALMQWISNSAWGKDRGFLYSKNPNWDFATQFRKWLEVTMTPQVFARIDHVTGQNWHLSASGNAASLRTFEVVTLLEIKIVVPAILPENIRIAFSHVERQGSSQKWKVVTKSVESQLIGSYKPEGYTEIILIWPADRLFGYIDILLEANNAEGGILFSEQQGARYTINLSDSDNPANLNQALSSGFASIDLLELEDAQATPLHKLAGDLTPVKAKETNHVG